MTASSRQEMAQWAEGQGVRPLLPPLTARKSDGGDDGGVGDDRLLYDATKHSHRHGRCACRPYCGCGGGVSQSSGSRRGGQICPEYQQLPHADSGRVAGGGGCGVSAHHQEP